jgi:predicted AAA+ superfamily ATPase
METFIFNEISSLIDYSSGKYRLHQYRDRDKREIDFIVERDDGALLGIEVKSGSSVEKSDFRHMNWFKDNLAKNKKFVGIIIYTGEYSSPLCKDMWVVNYSELWR